MLGHRAVLTRTHTPLPQVMARLRGAETPRGGGRIRATSKNPGVVTKVSVQGPFTP